MWSQSPGRTTRVFVFSVTCSSLSLSLNSPLSILCRIQKDAGPHKPLWHEALLQTSKGQGNGEVFVKRLTLLMSSRNLPYNEVAIEDHILEVCQERPIFPLHTNVRCWRCSLTWSWQSLHCVCISMLSCYTPETYRFTSQWHARKARRGEHTNAVISLTATENSYCIKTVKMEEQRKGYR